MAVTACTSYNEAIIFTGGTETPHSIMTDVVYSEALSAYTIVESIQCNTVLIGGNGLNS
jgi:hypothetical protein